MEQEKINIFKRRLEILMSIYSDQEEIQNLISELKNSINYLEVKQDNNYHKDITSIEESENEKELEISKIPYREMVDTNINFKSQISTEYFKSQITYDKLIRNIDLTALALKNYGIKKGDIVSICMPTTPETIYLFYALNKIGAVSNIIDPRKSVEEIKHCINNVESKLIFAIDSGASKIQECFNKTSLKKMFKLSPVESLPFFIKYLYDKSFYFESKKSKDKEIAFWDDFKRYSKSKDDVVEVEYEPNILGTIEYTSGTTGMPKGVEISNDAISGIARQYDLSGMQHSRQDKFYNGIPIFLAFGEALAIHMPYMFGFRNIVNPAMENEKILYDLMKFKPEHTSLTPIHYITMMNNPDFYKYDMSNVKTLGVGADSMTMANKREFNQKAKANGSKVGITTGYGNTEHNSSFSTERAGFYNLGSCGKCLAGNKIIFIDPNTNDVLPANVTGRAILIGKYPMLGYINNEEENNKAFVTLKDGQKGIDLGDYGYQDENGYIFIKGRLKDLIQINENETLWPSELENLITLSPKIKHCAVAGMRNGDYKIPRVYIVRKDNYTVTDVNEDIEVTIEQLEQYYNTKIEISYVKTLPITSNGKIDRLRLSQEDIYDEIERDLEDNMVYKKQY